MAFLGVAPTGTVLPFAGSTAPDGWAICNSGEYSKTTYAALFAVIGITYGETNGSGGVGTTHFRVPDMRGVFPRGSGTNGTSNYGGVTGHTPAGGSVGNKGGQKTAKNGLANSSSSLSGLTLNSSSISALSLGNQSADHKHTDSGHSHGSSNGLSFILQGAGFQAFSSGSLQFAGATSTANGSANLGNQSADHSHTLTSGTAAAQTLNSSTVSAQTISSTDAETTPASLSLNYIIKL